VYIRFLKAKPVKNWIQKRKTMKRYDITAEMYDARYSEEQKAKYKVAMEGLHVSSRSLILDVGCGTGLFFIYVAEKAKLVIGLDISSKLLAESKKRAKNICNVHLVRGDADYLPFREHSFSIVSAFTLLQNMPNPLITLTEIKRTAKPNGFFVITGLKKVFSLTTFAQLMKIAGLSLLSLRDDDFLKCYVAFGSLKIGKSATQHAH
jgi:ubiquinone/menaquinone biosynthesis C-methylase UbiE